MKDKRKIWKETEAENRDKQIKKDGREISDRFFVFQFHSTFSLQLFGG